jgi:hypothetical protein
MKLQEFLAWEEQQELRYEFDGKQPVGTTGGTAAHAIIQGNLARSVSGRIRDNPWAKPSVQRYVMLEQDGIGVPIFSRPQNDWVSHVLAEGVVSQISEIGIEMPLATFYDGLEFEADGQD